MRSLRSKPPRDSRSPIRCDAANCRRGAFTLIELVIVMLIMGIFAAAATPAFLDSLLYHRVESAARRVKIDLELARQSARVTSTSQSITFTASGYSFGAITTHFDSPTQTYAVNLKNDLYGLDTVTANFNNTTTATFDGYGTPTSGGTVVLKAKTHQCTVTLDAATGEVTITSNHARVNAPSSGI